jgi:hypothetical protein
MTGAVVLFLVLNPETTDLAIVIYTIGLDVFLILVLSQIMFELKYMASYSIFKSVSKGGNRLKVLMADQPPQVLLMHMLVWSAALNSVTQFY